MELRFCLVLFFGGVRVSSFPSRKVVAFECFGGKEIRERVGVGSCEWWDFHRKRICYEVP